ncbi:CU044_5270 family protein [Actinomycetes bacterium KLBMP 9797]
MTHWTERHDVARLLPELVERDLSSDRQRQLQEFVMSEIHQDLRAAERAPRRAPKRRLILAAAAVAAVTAVAMGAGTLGLARDGDAPRAGGQGEELTPVAQTFELAAAYAAARPFTAPRPDQWIYVESRIRNAGAVAQSKGLEPDVTSRTWKRGDGKQSADLHDGRLVIVDGTNQYVVPPMDYPTLAALPTDPRALLSRIQEWVAGPGTDQERVNSASFGVIASILRDNLLPPTVTASLMRAAALIPGVTLSSASEEVDGRQVTVVGRVEDGSRYEQLLLDRDTHAFVGHRTVAVQTGEAQVTITRLAARVVDAAGQTS